MLLEGNSPGLWDRPQGFVPEENCGHTTNGTAMKQIKLLSTMLLLGVSACGKTPVETEPVVASIAITPGRDTVRIGGTLQFMAEPRDRSGMVVAGKSVTWSSSDRTHATVDATGLVTGVASGDAAITAMSDGVSGTAVVTVVPVPVASVLISPAVDTIFVGATTQLSAQTRDASGNVLTGRTIMWTSDSTGVATVDAGGQVSAVTSGTATITATSEGIAGTAVVTVVPVPVASVVVTPAVDTVFVGTTTQLSAEPRDASGTPLTGRTVMWTSDSTAIATVDSTGLVSAVTPGDATITATSEGIDGTAVVTVQASAIGLMLGDLVAGSIDAAAENDLFRFSAQAGDEVLLSLVATSGFPAFVTARATVYSPTQVQVVQFDANRTEQLTLTESGAYTVVVTASNLFSTGTYNLGLEGLNPVTPTAVPLSLGDLVAGSLDSSGSVDMYTYQAQAGDIILSALTATSGFAAFVTPSVTIYSPTLTQISSYNANAQRQDTLPVAGRYILAVRASNLFNSGTYSLNLTGLQPIGPSAQVISCGDLVSASVDAPADIDLFTFSGQAGQAIILTLTTTGGFSAFVGPQITVFSPVLDQLALFNGTGQQQITLPTTGTYVFRVTANNLFGVGSYNLDLSCP